MLVGREACMSPISSWGQLVGFEQRMEENRSAGGVAGGNAPHAQAQGISNIGNTWNTGNMKMQTQGQMYALQTQPAPMETNTRAQMHVQAPMQTHDGWQQQQYQQHQQHQQPPPPPPPQQNMNALAAQQQQAQAYMQSAWQYHQPQHPYTHPAPNQHGHPMFVNNLASSYTNNPVMHQQQEFQGASMYQPQNHPHGYSISMPQYMHISQQHQEPTMYFATSPQGVMYLPLPANQPQQSQQQGQQQVFKGQDSASIASLVNASFQSKPTHLFYAQTVTQTSQPPPQQPSSARNTWTPADQAQALAVSSDLVAMSSSVDTSMHTRSKPAALQQQQQQQPGDISQIDMARYPASQNPVYATYQHPPQSQAQLLPSMNTVSALVPGGAGTNTPMPIPIQYHPSMASPSQSQGVRPGQQPPCPTTEPQAGSSSPQRAQLPPLNVTTTTTIKKDKVSKPTKAMISSSSSSNPDSAQKSDWEFERNRARARKCTQCGEQFREKAELMFHSHFTHGTEDVHPCMEEGCLKAFGRKSELTKHHACVHLKEKQFKCEKCGKSFYFKTDLRRHYSVVHQKERPFACSKCDSRFGKRDHLLRHMNALHHPVRPPKSRGRKALHRDVLGPKVRSADGAGPSNGGKPLGKGDEDDVHNRDRDHDHESDNDEYMQDQSADDFDEEDGSGDELEDRRPHGTSSTDKSAKKMVEKLDTKEKGTEKVGGKTESKEEIKTDPTADSAVDKKREE